MAGNKIGVIGMGVVGQAVAKGFAPYYQVLAYDTHSKRTKCKYNELRQAELIFVCVPTLNIGHQQSLKHVHDAVEKLHALPYTGLVILKSTVLPGTTADLEHHYPALKIIHNPEFLSEATAGVDFAAQKKVILGGQARHFPLAEAAYRKLNAGMEFIKLPSKESEMAKYIANVFFASKVTIFNEFFDICQEHKINFNDAKEAAIHATGWIAPDHTNVPGRHGRGFGGMCFPKDLEAFLAFGPKEHLTAITAVKTSNDRLRMRERKVH